MDPLDAARPVPLPVVPARRVARADVRVLGWGRALPAHRVLQPELAEHLAARLPAATGRRLRAAFRGSRIDGRHSVLPDFLPGRAARLFRGETPGTAERMAIFAEEAPPLAAAAARDALAASGAPADSITHLVFTTCTGFAAPGPDQELVRRLALPADVRRVQIGYQGCSAGIVGLRTAAEIARGERGARVLVVATELASLHFRDAPDDDDLRAHALFADGAGAAVVGRRRGARGDAPGDAASVRLGRGASRLLPDSADDMTWSVGDDGFRMRLSARVPDALSAALPAFVGSLAPRGPASVAHWAIHPGGPAVLDRVRDALGLAEEDLAASRETLAACGNMSSATIFFVMGRIARAGRPGDGLALAFGPGLTVEGLRFRVVA